VVLALLVELLPLVQGLLPLLVLVLVPLVEPLPLPLGVKIL